MHPAMRIHSATRRNEPERMYFLILKNSSWLRIYIPVVQPQFLKKSRTLYAENPKNGKSFLLYKGVRAGIRTGCKGFLSFQCGERTAGSFPVIPYPVLEKNSICVSGTLKEEIPVRY
jgi:hypothetical protein